MKKLISILSITAMGVNSLVIPIQNVSKKKEEFLIKNNLNINKQSEQNIKIAEQWYSKIANTEQETIFKDNLISAISLKDEQINFDLNKINKTLWSDNNIYNLISNPKYIKNLQLMYDLNILQFVDGKVQFLEKPNYYEESGIWIEAHWNWYGYWRLHIGHKQCQWFLKMVETGASHTVILEALLELISEAGPEALAVALIIALEIIAGAALVDHYDKGNGIWLGYYATYNLISDWGSD